MTFVYIRSEPGLWTVGHYAQDQRFQPESDHGDEDEAARRTAWLNGAPSDHAALIEQRDELAAEVERLKARPTTDMPDGDPDDYWLRLRAELRRAGDQLGTLAGTDTGEPWYVHLSIAGHSNSDSSDRGVAIVNAVAAALDLPAGKAVKGGSFWYHETETKRGPLKIMAETRIPSPEDNRVAELERQLAEAKAALATRPALDTAAPAKDVRMALFNAEQTGQLVLGAYLTSSVLVAILDAGYGTPILGGVLVADGQSGVVGFQITDTGRQVSTATGDACPFTHSHTRAWCGYAGCRES